MTDAFSIVRNNFDYPETLEFDKMLINAKVSKRLLFAKGILIQLRNGFYITKTKINKVIVSRPQRIKIIKNITGEVLVDISDKVKNILSDKEMEVVDLLASGLNDKQIGLKLFLSSYTILTHRQKYNPKMGAKNTVEAVVKAYRLI